MSPIPGDRNEQKASSQDDAREPVFSGEHAITEESVYAVPRGDVAVLLNANAGRAKRSVIRTIRSVCPEALVFWTHSLEEAQDAIEAAIESEVTTIFGGGGDGTIIDLANRLLRYEHSPRLGILRLGTGNALASWVGARSVADDLAAWHRGDAFRELPLRLCKAEAELFPFAGLGWDAAVLNDYRWVKDKLEGTPLESKSQHLAVYLASAFGRTVPRMATSRDTPLATIEILAGEAWRIDRFGTCLGNKLQTGDILYRGSAHMTAFGTTPFYGYNLRMLPHATAIPSHFQLRVSAMDVVTSVNELPRIWAGDLEHDRLFDFLAQSIKITYDRPVPYQVGGEARGLRSELILKMDSDQLPVLSFS